MWRAVAAAGVLAVAACTPLVPNMAPEAARLTLERFAENDPPADVCTPEGASLLRAAVRARAQEAAETGARWPNVLEADARPRTEMHAEDVVVFGAVAAGFVKVSDLQGDVRRDAQRLARAWWPQMRTARAAARIACPEVRDFLFASAEYVADIDRFRARQQALSERRHGWDDIERHMRAVGRLQARAHEIEALRLALEAKLKESGVAF